MNPNYYEDPVAAYDRLAACYAGLSSKREPYLRGIEREILSRISPRSRSLMDVGAGDGIRGLRLASQSGIGRVVLVEPSKEMAAHVTGSAEVWPVRAESLVADVAHGTPRACGPGTGESARLHTGCGGPGAIAERFDVITCLWNVLGHIPSAEKRLRALAVVAGLLDAKGRFFLDVNHRYNARSYGTLPTVARWIHDLVFSNQKNGDVTARWNVGDRSVSTCGHFFTHSEIMRLAGHAGLELEERMVVDYQSGDLCRFAFQGNLLYIFRRRSRIDSSSASQTS